MIKQIKIESSFITINFEEDTIELYGRKYKRDEIMINKTFETKTNSKRNGSVRGSVRIARGVYVSRSVPTYKTETISYTKIVIKEIKNGFGHTFIERCSNDDIDYLMGWYDKKDYFELQKEINQKITKRKEEQKVENNCFLIASIVSILTMFAGHFIIALALFAPVLFSCYMVNSICEKGWNSDTINSAISWVVTFVICIVHSKDIMMFGVMLFTSIWIYLFVSILLLYISKKIFKQRS